MTRSRALSAHARNVLAILAEAAPGWCHGYELCRRAGIKSGTLYPLLIRLEAQDYLEAEWQEPAEAGRPPRHAYRLTAAGLSTTIFFYFSVNLMMVMGLAPVVGIPLPLVSFGGSAVMTVMLCLGILMSLERQARTRNTLI